MKHNQSEKYSIAWFKIADYVLRGERERAFGVYRLLAYSIKNEALVVQLEGDILWAFNDLQALSKYVSAAELYIAADQCDKAICLYEQILSLDSMHSCRSSLLLLYAKLNKIDEIKKHLPVWKTVCIKNRSEQSYHELVEEIRPLVARSGDLEWIDKLK